jgi:hypothetical protein
MTNRRVILGQESIGAIVTYLDCEKRETRNFAEKGSYMSPVLAARHPLRGRGSKFPRKGTQCCHLEDTALLRWTTCVMS